MANSVDPDGTARHEPSHLDLHCLHRYLFWSAGLRGLVQKCLTCINKSLVFPIFLVIDLKTLTMKIHIFRSQIIPNM